MLFAGLQGQPIGPVAVGINRHAHNPPRHCTFHFIFARHIGRMRSAIPLRHTKALRRSNGDIRPHLTWFFQQRQGQRVRRNDTNRVCLMQRCNVFGEITYMAIRAGILKNRTKYRRRVHLVGIANNHVDAQRCRSGLHHCNILWMAITVYKKRFCLRLRHPLRHGHCFGTGCCLVQQGRIGNLKPRQIADHGLKIQQRLKSALRNLGLIGRIGRVPRWVFQNVPLDRGRCDRAMIALTDQAGQHFVFVGGDAHMLKHFALRHRLAKIERFFHADRWRQRIINQGRQRFRPNRLEHIRHFSRRRPDMAAIGKIIRQIVCRFEGHRGHPCFIVPKYTRLALAACVTR